MEDGAMAESALEPQSSRRPIQREWVFSVFFHPKRTFRNIVATEKPVWFLPLLLISITGILFVIANGWIKQSFVAGSPAELPQYFQYYSPEQQAQFMQALQATTGTTFVYVLPSLLSLAKVWVGWLIVGNAVYLVLTALGSGLKSTRVLNIAAWAALPFGLRDLVRTLALVILRTPIHSPGISGFAPTQVGSVTIFVTAMLSLIDVYLIWHMVLLNVGALSDSKVSAVRTIFAITITLCLIVALQALISFGIASLASNLSVMQVFI
jgi:hypothetical protein